MDAPLMADDLANRLLAQIEEHESKNREQARANYPDAWKESRRLFLGILSRLQRYKAGVPGHTSAEIQEKLVLIASYTQGVSLTERMISGGQYIKAAAALKQELETVVRLEEVRAGVAKKGKTPNMKHAPPGGKKAYGLLNSIAHPSRLEFLMDLVFKYSHGAINGVSVYPSYIPPIAEELYCIHVSLLRDIASHQIMLAAEMYDLHDAEVQTSIDEHEAAHALLRSEVATIGRQLMRQYQGH